MRTLVGLARAGAEAVGASYEGYRREFQRLTHRAREHFESRDWPSGQRDAVARLELYRRVIEGLVGELEELFGDHLRDPAVWKAMKEGYSELSRDFPDVELAETFYNSVTRKVFTTVGVDPEIEYVDLDIRRARYGHGSVAHRRFERRGTVAGLVREAVGAFGLETPFHDLDGDADRAAAELQAAWRRAVGTRGPELAALELVGSVFYRGSGAYLVGRMRAPLVASPVVLVLVNGERGLEIDAVLTGEREVSVAFSYTRSHFLVDVARPADVIRFLATLMPRKPLAELYIALGWAKHGKTEMYRDLIGHMRRSMERFEVAEGQRGMVMIVFTLPSHEYVFKVIRDEFAPPKTNTRQDVMRRYHLVFHHDRAGRMIEAHEFEQLIFDEHRFDPELLRELVEEASTAVSLEDGQVRLRHLYMERRVRPLDLFVRERSEGEAHAALLDYGQALRDLARTNIFPGDLLLKNFGVTRNGRVTFYDYDELCLVTDCEFRELPPARSHDEELAAEPWFAVGEHDVFPEEFVHFLGLPRPLREFFARHHAEVLTARFWRELQARHRAGEVLDVLPYPPSRRLRA